MSSEWENKNPLSYAYNGETLDSFMRKTKLTFEQIFELLNILHSAGAQAGLDASDASAYTLRVNTQDNCLYMRSGDNTRWINLGKIEENFGITASKIGAIANGGNIGKFSGGLDANKPRTNNSTNDFYFATDSNTVYRWTGNAWVAFLSLDFSKLLDYEKYCVNRNELGTSGKGKVLQLDPVTGKANVDITGSPERLLGYEIDVRNFKDGDVLVFNEQKQKIVNLPKDEVKGSDVSYTGEANKLVKVAGDGKAHIDITGSAGSINGIKSEDIITKDDVTDSGVAGKIPKIGTDGTINVPVVGSADKINGVDVISKGMKEGQVFALVGGMLKPIDVVKMDSDGTIHANITGTASKIGTANVQVSNLQDGQILVFKKAIGAWKNEAKSAVGAGKSLILYDGGQLLAEYNGAETKSIDIANIIANSSSTNYVNHLLRLIENLHLTLTVAGLDPGGYDGLLSAAYNAATKTFEGLDNTNCLVSSIVKGDDSIDVENIEMLNVGESYRLIEGEHVEDVTVKYIKPVYNIKRVILTKPVQYQFTPNVARLERSSYWTVNSEGKIEGDNLMLISKPAMFNVRKSRCHLVVKHQVSGNPDIKAYVAFRNSYLDTESYAAMRKVKFYIDQNNQNRGSTEFIFTAGTCTCGCTNCTCRSHGGIIATIKIIATGSPVIIDSFAAVFNE